MQSLALHLLHCDKILKTDWTNATQLMERYNHILSSCYVAFHGNEGSISCLQCSALKRCKGCASFCEPA